MLLESSAWMSNGSGDNGVGSWGGRRTDFSAVSAKLSVIDIAGFGVLGDADGKW
jgi:hypothetical protein